MKLSPIGYRRQSTIVHSMCATISDMKTIGERMCDAGTELWGDRWRVELGAVTKLSRQTISKIEHGATKNPQPATLFVIADALGVEARWLGTGAGPMRPKRPLTEDQQRWLAIQERLSADQQLSLARFLDQVGELPPSAPASNDH